MAALAVDVLAAPDVDVLLLCCCCRSPRRRASRASATSATETCLDITDLLDGRAPDRAKHRSVQPLKSAFLKAIRPAAIVAATSGTPGR